MHGKHNHDNLCQTGVTNPVKQNDSKEIQKD